MTARLPPAMVARIDSICDRYEAAWKNGQEPRLEDFLEIDEEPALTLLRQELARLDAHYRHRDSAEVTFIDRARPIPANRLSIAGYEVLGELGRGGMGIVYKARQRRPNRLVAIKMISAGANAGPRELERFLREADAVAQLQHPNIVHVYEVGEHEGRPYFALEYVTGGSLDSHLTGTPQHPRVVAHFIEQLALAIHHAHERGIIHRDLKPANILMEQRGQTPSEATKEQSQSASPSSLATHLPKITDFGLAKLMDKVDGNPTQSGDVLGTPSYMAPEQVVGSVARIGPATDVYGLGAILYELLTGRPPFRGETALETMLQVQTVEPVSPSRLQPRCPRDLVTICIKCLSKQTRERYSSAADLADDLRRFQAGESINARPVGPIQKALKWTRRQPIVASLAALLIVAITAGMGTGSWFWWLAEEGLKQTEQALRKERAAQVERVATLDRYQVALAQREWLANNVRQTDELLDACTPDQRRSWEWRYLDRMRHSALNTFTGHTNTIQALAIHPSGKQVASASHDSTIRLWDLNANTGSILGHQNYLALAVAYSPDGQWLASSGSHDGRLRLWDLKNGGPVRDFYFEGNRKVAVWGLSFDPTSRYLAAGGPKRLKVWDLREQKWIYDRVADRGELYHVAFSPDGRSIATASTKVKVWDWTANKLLHEWPGHGVRTWDLAYSPDGNLLASGGRNGLVQVHNLQTGEQEFILNAHDLSVTSVAFSPDSQRLASAGEEGNMNVWSVPHRRLLFTLHGHSGAVWDLRYTPDGSRLVSAGSDFAIRAWNANSGQESLVLPVRSPDEIRAVTYDPSGRYLAWGDIRGRVGVWDNQLEKESLRIDRPDPRGRNPITSLAFSSDGRRLAWRQSFGPTKLWDLASKAEVPLTVSMPVTALGLSFSAEGNQLWEAYSEDNSLHVRDLLAGQEVLSLPPFQQPVSQVIWTPDKLRFATIEPRTQVQVWKDKLAHSRLNLEGQPSVTCLAFSHDGRFVATGGVAGKLRVWDLVENRETMVVTGHSSNIYGLALSPDGRRLASAASDCTVKLWDTQSGHEVLTLRTQLHEHSPLAFSPSGEDLISVNIDNHLQVWSAKASAPSTQQPQQPITTVLDDPPSLPKNGTGSRP